MRSETENSYSAGVCYSSKTLLYTSMKIQKDKTLRMLSKCVTEQKIHILRVSATVHKLYLGYARDYKQVYDRKLVCTLESCLIQIIARMRPLLQLIWQTRCKGIHP